MMKSKNLKKTISIVLVLLFFLSGFTASINSEQELFYSDVGGFEPERYSTIQEVQIDKNNTEYIWNTYPKYQLQKTTSDSMDLIACSNEHIENFGNNRNDRSCWQSNLFENNIPSIKQDKKLENKLDTIPVFFSNYNPQVYTPHPPIEIEHNTEFTEENGVVSGNGTKNDPFIIEGWEISTSGDAIEIKDTTAYFLIRNCHILGQIFFYNTSNGILSSINQEYTGNGLYIDSSNNILIEESNLYSGICIRTRYSSNITAIQNNLSVYGEYGTGILTRYSDHIAFEELIIHDGAVGISTNKVHNASIINCSFFSNTRGLSIVASQTHFLRNNQFHDNSNSFLVGGFDLKDYSHDIDKSNLINGKPIYYLKDQHDQVFDGSEDIGFFALINCENIRVKNFDLSGNGVGIKLAGTKDVTVMNSDFSMNAVGGSIVRCSNTVFENCSFGEGGFYNSYSHQTIFRNNEMGYFEVIGESADDCYHDIDTSNMVSGKPIQYIVGESDVNINRDDCGYLGIVDCDNFNVNNIDISGVGQGILIADSTGIVKNCDFSENLYGIQLYDSSQIEISRCTISTNFLDGVTVFGSSDITIKRCNVKRNGFYGIYLWNSFNNHISRCTISDNSEGIKLENAWENTILNNRINGGSAGISIRYEISRENDVLLNTILNCDGGIIIYDYATLNMIHHNEIKRTGINGIQLYEANENYVHHNDIINNDRNGVTIVLCSDSIIEYNNIDGNDDCGLEAVDCTVNAENNYWGHRSGPSGIGPGNGDVIDDNGEVVYEPWLNKPVRVKLHYIFYLLFQRS